jgi:hypothetical protein
MGQQPVQLVVVPDRQKNMSWNDPKLVVVFCSVSSQLKDLIADRGHDQYECWTEKNLKFFGSPPQLSEVNISGRRKAKMDEVKLHPTLECDTEKGGRSPLP